MMPKSAYNSGSYNSSRRSDVKKAADKPKVCPTCGRKVSASNQGGAAVGGGAGG